MVKADTLLDLFPELTHIESNTLRAQVISAWQTACSENDIAAAELTEIQWQPPEQNRLGIADAPLIEHVRDVAQGAIGLGELMIDRRDVEVSLDLIVAGALVHDVSKLYEYEFSTGTLTPIGDRIGHPHYGLYVAGTAGLPVEVLHILIAHSSRTSVDPATLEAEIVRRADEVAAGAIRQQGVDGLRSITN